MFEPILFSYLGIPYMWGGNNRLTGLDCSGLTCDFLRSVGVGPQSDLNAQGLFQYLSLTGTMDVEGMGAICFYGKSKNDLSHVGIYWHNGLIFEAGGGDSTTTNMEEAKKKGACVRIRPMKHRRDFYCVIMPKYPASFLE